MNLWNQILKQLQQEYNMELKSKIKQTLLEERQRRLEESFVELGDVNDINYFIKIYSEVTEKLISEGFYVDEINDYVLNEFDLPSSEDIDKMDWGKVITGGMLSGVKEYVINFILTNIFGANPDFSRFTAQVLADYNVLDLLKPFKNESLCVSEMPKLVDALLEASSRYIGASVSGVNQNNYSLSVSGISTTLAGNMFGEVIRQSNIGEEISNRFCKIIH
jgi:hypothetical protein